MWVCCSRQKRSDEWAGTLPAPRDICRRTPRPLRREMWGTSLNSLPERKGMRNGKCDFISLSIPIGRGDWLKINTVSVQIRGEVPLAFRTKEVGRAQNPCVVALTLRRTTRDDSMVTVAHLMMGAGRSIRPRVVVNHRRFDSFFSVFLRTWLSGRKRQLAKLFYH